jgi:hypothetical protein
MCSQAIIASVRVFLSQLQVELTAHHPLQHTFVYYNAEAVMGSRAQNVRCPLDTGDCSTRLHLYSYGDQAPSEVV